MEKKTKGFRVKIEAAENIYRLLKEPTRRKAVLGKAVLSPPFEEIRLLSASSGKEISLEVYIDVGTFIGEDKQPYYYPLALPLLALMKRFQIFFVQPKVVHVYPSKDAAEPRFVITRHDGQIIVSAGKYGEESAPAISLTTPEDLRVKLEFLGRIVETMVQQIYKLYAGSAVSSDASKPHFSEPDVNFYIRGPVNNKEPEDDSGGSGDKYEKEYKTAVHKIEPEEIEVTLDDVQGADEAKEEVMEVIDFLKNPEKYEKVGAKVPRGVLLSGPPGTGKTMLAKAVAKAAGVPFYSASGSEFVAIYVGMGAAKVRALFNAARKDSPCIIFIDELDSLARQRTGGSGGQAEYDHALSQILTELDGFERNKGIIVMAATNAPELLDPSIMRPGRLDRHIVMDLPDAAGREAILRVHAKNKPLSDDVNLKEIALSANGFSGAELASLLNEAALLAAREQKEKIEMKHVISARERVRMGPPRRTRLIQRERFEVACHEAGHAIAFTLFYPLADPVELVTIVPRSTALGMVLPVPEEDIRSDYKNRLETEIACRLAGRVAEVMVLGKSAYSTGASADIRNSTGIARRMVTEWGMGRKTGLASLGRNLAWKFLGGAGQSSEGCSEKTSQMIDDEVRRILKKAYKKAKKILKHHKKELLQLAQMLVERETLSGKEVRKLLKKPLPSEK